MQVSETRWKPVPGSIFVCGGDGRLSAPLRGPPGVGSSWTLEQVRAVCQIHSLSRVSAGSLLAGHSTLHLIDPSFTHVQPFAICHLEAELNNT